MTSYPLPADVEGCVAPVQNERKKNSLFSNYLLTFFILMAWEEGDVIRNPKTHTQRSIECFVNKGIGSLKVVVSQFKR